MAWRGQLSRNLKELRILFSPNSSSSSSTRAFIENNYKDLKTKNPKLPILIREATGIEPQLWARYVESSRGLPSGVDATHQCLHVRALVFRPYVPLSDAGNLSHEPSLQTIRGCSSTDAKWSEPSPPVDRPEAKFFH